MTSLRSPTGSRAAPASNDRIAVGIMCKAPVSGLSKTRLCPPLSFDDAAALSRAFIADVAATVAAVAAADEGSAVSGFAIYTPLGAEAAFDGALPPGFRCLAQRGVDLGDRLLHASEDLLADGFAGVCLINSDSPTLPSALIADTVALLRQAGDRMVLAPAIDGGYTLIGLKRAHAALFQGIAWSSSLVLAQTLSRAAAAGFPVSLLPLWYDVDEAAALELLSAELFGNGIALEGEGGAAVNTRVVLSDLRNRGRVGRLPSL